MGRFQNKKRSATNRQAGYMLLVMMLFITLMAIAALAVVPKMEMQVKRDREEEMIHRGAQYARAIRLYVKKYGRYPLSVTDLQDTNNLHFLRKAYKDPISGKDFRLLHMQDVQMLMMGAGGMGPGGFTGNPGAAAGAGMPGSPAGTPVTGGNGSADNSAGGSTGGDNASGTGGDNSGNATANGNSGNGNSPGGNSGGGFGSSGGAGQVFGGGPIMGVASVSKDKTIRVFNNKDHYNEWLFVYDPTNDRGLITGPYQPSFAGLGMNGINGMNSTNGNGMNTNGAANNNGLGFGAQGTNGFQPMQMQPSPGAPTPQH